MKIIKIILITIISLILLLVIINLLFTNLPSYNSYQKVSIDKETGKLVIDWACIGFDKYGSYGMYDCESEPSGYAYDTEYQCRYLYINKNLYFYCLYSAGGSHFHKVEVKEWNDETFTINDEDGESTFKSKEWILENIDEE